jgi:squalene cyclase
LLFGFIFFVICARYYDQIETYRNLSELLEKFGLNKKHLTVRKAANFFFSHQTSEGDFRGIYGNQYSPNYSAAIMELLIKAGYDTDKRIEKGFQWLLSIRQNDGGWAIPFRTISASSYSTVLSQNTIQPDRTKLFSNLVTVVALRAFAAHPKCRTTKETRASGELLASRFFERDKYSDRRNAEYWFKFSYPYWFTDLLSALDSLSAIGLDAENPQIARALRWFVSEQQQNGAWKLKTVRGRDKDTDYWINLAICRVFKRFGS